MSTDAATTDCKVCNEPTETHTEAVCNACGGTYHLNQRADMPGKDCGEVWINEEHMGLEFACNVCLHPEAEEGQGGLDDILDLPEAAAATGISEAMLLVAVEQGSLRGKRITGGAVIFERRDVVEYAARQA
jgi:hypothetical protein